MIVVQAGHLNIASNCDWGLRPDTGLEGEADQTAWFAQQLSSRLMGRGLPCQVVDANFNCVDLVSHPYQALIALHCDDPVVADGGRAVDIGVADGGAELAQAIDRRLGAALGTPPARPPDGGADYYLIPKLSPQTPFVLVQLGAVDEARAMADKLLQAVYVGVLDWLGMPETEPEPEWKRNLQPHQALIVLNRPVAEVDLATGIRGNPVQGALQVAFATRARDLEYYATAESVRGGLGFLRTEADAAGGVTSSAPLLPPAPAPPAAPEAAAEPVAAPAPASDAPAGPPAPASGLLGRLRELHGLLPELIAHLEGLEKPDAQ